MSGFHKKFAKQVEKSLRMSSRTTEGSVAIPLLSGFTLAGDEAWWKVITAKSSGFLTKTFLRVFF